MFPVLFVTKALGDACSSGFGLQGVNDENVPRWVHLEVCERLEGLER